MPVVAPIAAVATAGAAVYSAVKQNKAAKKAQEAAEAEARRQERIARVQELKQNTLNAIGDVNAPEWTEFYDYAIKHPEDVDGVKKKSEEAINQYNDREKKTATVPEATGQEQEKTNAFNGGVGQLNIPMLGMLLQAASKSIAQQPGRNQQVQYIPHPVGASNSSDRILEKLMPILIIALLIYGLNILVRRKT